MHFDTNQPSYTEFRDVLKQKTCPVVIFGGAGLSAPANIPTWSVLRESLANCARQNAGNCEPAERLRCEGLIQAAIHEPCLWDSFSLLRKALGPTSYPAAIRAALSLCSNVEPPSIYEQFWKLGIRGFVTLNVDRFAARSFAKAKGSVNLAEFKGRDAKYNADILRSGTPFAANLHGILDEDSSWVFAREDFDALFNSPGFVEFVNTLLMATTILFVGISADDLAAGGHLERLKTRGVSLKGHYWITHRNDQSTHRWAENAGLRQILFPLDDGKFTALDEALSDLKRYIPVEVIAAPVVPIIAKRARGQLPAPIDLIKLSAEEIRLLLNAEAVRILSLVHPNRLVEYESFLREYSECIYRARWISLEAGSNQFFGYLLESTIASGGFGEVFKCKDPSGKDVAIKILRAEAFRERGMLDGFRRGIRAMHILTERNLKGVVPYLNQWEIPAAVVMEFVNGANLEQAVQWGQIDSWLEILSVSVQLVNIVRASHNVPERVLHRDVKPANIMLRTASSVDCGWEVVVLDFDLSWHRDAVGYSVPMASGSFYGYIAPELVGLGGKAVTRNALVDSFGIGMTLCYVVTKNHPVFGQQRQADWCKLLEERVNIRPCREWHSLPRRFSRLILGMTQDEQGKRWDLSRAMGELDRLLEACHGEAVVGSCELVCEELVSRCEGLKHVYVWDESRLMASLELPTGFHAKLVADEMLGKILIDVGWNNLGDRKFETVKKYIGPRTDECVSQLGKGGFTVREKVVNSESCRIKADIHLKALARRSEIVKSAAALDGVIEALRIPGWGRQ